MEKIGTNVTNAVIVEAKDFQSKTGKDMFSIKLEDNSLYSGFGHCPVKVGDVVSFSYSVSGIYQNVRPEDILKVLGTASVGAQDTGGVASSSYVDKRDEILLGQCFNIVGEEGTMKEGKESFKKAVKELYYVLREIRLEVLGK